MIFCNYKSENEKTVTYLFGGHPSDITGEIIFAKDGTYFEIAKEPNEEKVYLRSIRNLYDKYKVDFSQNIFGEKISFES